MNPYLSILGTLLFTVYGQIALKYRVDQLKIKLPESFLDKIIYVIKLLFDPIILSAFVAAFIASLFWIATMSKMEITKAYPFMSLAPALVFLVGIILLNESFSWGKVIGLIFIIIGTIVTVKF
ncbi:MAG: EamA family transporter [Flavobacteriaceae bacterium]|nr:EamA family transporter [Flavobacteriaceae bacterium]